MGNRLQTVDKFGFSAPCKFFSGVYTHNTIELSHILKFRARPTDENLLTKAEMQLKGTTFGQAPFMSTPFLSIFKALKNNQKCVSWHTKQVIELLVLFSSAYIGISGKNHSVQFVKTRQYLQALCLFFNLTWGGLRDSEWPSMLCCIGKLKVLSDFE